MRLTSTAFTEGDELPQLYTSGGQNISPPLSWTGVPNDAKSLALVVDDPESPERPWVHWIVTDIPPALPGLQAGARNLAAPRIGLNDWERAEWGGPAPPAGRHRFRFRLYALDCELRLDQPTKADLDAAIDGHVLAEAKLTATYENAQAA